MLADNGFICASLRRKGRDLRGGSVVNNPLASTGGKRMGNLDLEGFLYFECEK